MRLDGARSLREPELKRRVKDALEARAQRSDDDSVENAIADEDFHRDCGPMSATVRAAKRRTRQHPTRPNESEAEMSASDVFLPGDVDSADEHRRLPGPVLVTASGVVHQFGCPRAGHARGPTLTVAAEWIAIPEQSTYTVCPLCHR